MEPPDAARPAVARILFNDRTLFVVVNVAVNLLFLLRSYVTMRTLTYSALGLVALLQTIILLVSALQFGVVNGGYRLVCSEDAERGSDRQRFGLYVRMCARVVCSRPAPSRRCLRLTEITRSSFSCDIRGTSDHSKKLDDEFLDCESHAAGA